MAKKILIVDDEPDVVKVLSMRLSEHQFDVDVAFNGKEALEETKRFCPDLIVTDIMMPVMNGIEFASKLKEDPATSHIPIIFLSALQSKQEEVLQGNLIGSNFILAKPYDIQEMISLINKILNPS